MVDIFDEVSEDLRADRARALYLRYRLLAVAGMVGIVAGVAGFEAWQHYQARRANAVATSFLQATALADRTGDEAAHRTAADDFARIARKASGGYAILSRLREAALRDDLGDHAKANALWQDVADDSHAPAPLRELAGLLLAQHGVDDGNAADLLQRLAPLRDPSNAYHGLADEAASLLDLRIGKTDEARGILKRLVDDPQASQGLRARANALLDSLGDDPSPAAPDSAPPTAIQIAPAPTTKPGG